MKITKKRRQGSWVLRLVGPLARGKNMSVLRAAVEGLARRGQRRVILDLAGVAYMDAAGIGEIILCDQRVRAEGGRMVLAAAPGHVRQILRLSNVIDHVPTMATVDDALRSLRRSRRHMVQNARQAGVAVRELPVSANSKGPAIIRRTNEGPWRFTPIHG